MTSELEPVVPQVLPVMLTVSAVARRLGVAPSTLRTWDRRYGLGPSGHSAGSHRRYSPADLSRLVVMRGLVNEGVPPAEAAQIALGTPADDAGPAGPTAVRRPPGDPAGGDAADGNEGAGLPADDRLPGRFGSPLDPRLDQVLGRADPAATGPRDELDDDLDDLLDGTPAPEESPAPAPARAGGGRVVSLPDGSPRARGLARAAMALDQAEITRIFRDAVVAYGVVGAWNELALPVLQGLGERWRATGDGVEVEHLLSESLLGVLRGVSATLYRPRNVRPVLLACADGDYHSLPLHVLSAALAEVEVGSRMLGVGVPAHAMVAAVRRTGPSAVFLYARIPVLESAVLAELPRQRPAPRVIVGGGGWHGVQLPPSVVAVDTLQQSVDEVLGSLHV